MNINNVIDRQKQSLSKVIYGSVIHQNHHSYKRLLLDASQPKIIALGSSRVLQFRQHMFLDKFINLGRAMGSINEGINLLPDIMNKDPDIILLGVDVWWFNDKFQNPSSNYIEKEIEKALPSPIHAVNFYEWLFDGKIALATIKSDFLSGTTHIGVAGQENDGFGPDGSYYYTRLLTGAKQSDDKLFKDTFKRIENGNRRFEYNYFANNQYIDSFIQLVRALEDQKIEVIVFLNPFPQAVNRRLEDMGEKYQYISDIKIKLQKSSIKYYDYTDVSILNSGDCEFIDGFHGGEVTYMRILSDLGMQVPSLHNFIDQRLLRESINKYKGKAFIPDKEITDKIEIDFLGIGCNK